MNNKTVSSNENEHHLDDSEQEGLPSWLKASLIVVACAAIGILLLYFFNFNGPTGDQETFAQFGDYLGGTLNPILGFATVGLLIWSIRLQMKELRLTREELRATKKEAELSRIALQKQVEHLDNEAKLKKYSEMIDSLDAKYERLICKPIYDNDKAVNCLHSIGQLFRQKITCEDFIERSFCGLSITNDAVAEFVDFLDSASVSFVAKYQWKELEKCLLTSYMLVKQYGIFVGNAHLTEIYLESLIVKMLKVNVYVRSEEINESMKEIQQIFDKKYKIDLEE